LDNVATINIRTTVGQCCNYKYWNYNCTIIVTINIGTTIGQCCNCKYWNYNCTIL